MNALTEFGAWKIKVIEARIYDKLGDAVESKSPDYNEIRANWLTAHYAVQYFAAKFPEIMKRVQI